MEEQVIVQKVRSEHTSLNIKELFFKYVRFLPLYIICVALALFGAYMYLRYTTESYLSSAKIVIQDEKSSSTGNSAIEKALQPNEQKNIAVEIEILRSGPLMQRVVQRLNLNFNYAVKGKIKELDIYKVAPFQINALRIADSSVAFTLNLNFVSQQGFRVNGAVNEIKFGQVFKNEFGEFTLQRLNTASIPKECIVRWYPSKMQAGMLLGNLVVVPQQSTGIFTVAVEAASPQLAADVINSLILEYQAATIEKKNRTSQQQLDFIDKELDSVAQQLDSINNRFVAYRNANNIIETSQQANNLLVQIEASGRELKVQRLKVNSAVQIEDYLGQRANIFSTVPSSLGIEDQTLQTLVGEYNRAQFERKELLENAPENNVVVRQKTEQIESLRSRLLESVKNIKTSFAAAIGSLQNTTSTATAQVLTMPAKERGLLDIQRDLQSKVFIYNSLLGKKEEAALKLASTISDITVLQPATPNRTPIKPNRRNTQLISFLIGMLIPTIIIIVVELLNDKVNSRHDIERLTDATILGEVGHSFGDKALIVTSGNRKVIAEQFRILRSNLQYILTNAPKPVIMVTSSFSGEGKSFISTNMGAVMALANKRTIILEFDIRKPKILSGLDMPKSAGLTNFILGKVALADLPVPIAGYTNLYVLPCGPTPPNPGELLLDARLDELFVYLRQNFDVIVMDTAPVGMVSDAMTLSKYADCTLYILRQRHTYKKQITLADNYNREGKLPKISLVLNDVKVQGGYGGYGYGGKYGYGYGSGYFEDEPESRSFFGRLFGRFNGSNKTKKTKTTNV